MRVTLSMPSPPAGPVPAMIAIAFHTAGALGKLFSEVAENADLKPVEGLTSVGASWGQKMWLGVIPQVAPDWLSYALQRFEINIRASAILGFVGAGGLGQLLYFELSLFHHAQASTVIIAMLLLSIAVDQTSAWLRRYLK